jgi:hypothetical protein
MHLFTIKDLMLYNQPCLCCGGKTTLRWSITPSGGMTKQSTIPFELDASGMIRFPLQVRYDNNLSVLVAPASNAYQAVSQSGTPNLFPHFIRNHSIRCRITCNGCPAEILSMPLIFENDYIAPVALDVEFFLIKDSGYRYFLDTHHQEDNTCLIVDFDTQFYPPEQPKRYDLPLMPRYHFKDRQQLISRLKVCVLFA